MSHDQPHHAAGSPFKVRFHTSSPAIYDRSLESDNLTLVDWADRIALYSRFSKSCIELALMFYAHRCLPDREPDEKISMTSLDLTGLVIGVRRCTFEDKSIDELVIVREDETTLI